MSISGIPLVKSDDRVIGGVEVTTGTDVRLTLATGHGSMGNSAFARLTPDESRELAGALRRGADEVEANLPPKVARVP